MTDVFPDAPIAVVVIHLVMLSVLLVHTVVVNVRRRRVLQQSREGSPGIWSRLLFSLGFTKD